APPRSHSGVSPMLRFALCAAAVIAAVPAARADDPAAKQNWLLTYQQAPAFEQVMCILALDNVDGNPGATVVASPPRAEMSVKKFKHAGKEVTIELSNGTTFVGTSAGPGKPMLGSFGNESIVMRAKLVPTEKSALTQADLVIRGAAPEALTKAQQLTSKP